MLKAVSATGGSGGSGSGVTSLNSETGALTLTSSGATVVITQPTGSTINLEASGGASVAFTAITSGTNTTAAMVIGAGASLATFDNNVAINNSADATKQIKFSAGGMTTGKISTLTFTNANTAAYTFPAATDTIIGRASTDTLTNKTLTAPVMTAPVLGTPASGVATNLTGTAAGLTAGNVTTNANLTGAVTSSGNATSLGSFSSADLAGALTDETGTGAAVFGTSPTLSNPVVGTQSAGDNSTKGASTAYVTSAISTAISGVNPAVAVQAATTAAGNTSTYTYNNGVSGIGATLTAGSNNVALVVDGYTFTALGQRLLVKNDTQSPSGAFNGVYYVTQVQASILPVILTRALDYDQSSDINNTGAIPVVNGTLNGSTSWVLTSTVATVGTDPLTFAKFTLTPSTIVVNNAANTITAGIQYLNGATLEEAVFSNGNSGTSKAVNLDNGNLQSVTITGAVAITQTTPTNPGKYTLIVKQDGTGHVYSLSGIKWPGASAPTYSTAANAIDVISVIYDGTNYYGMGGIAFS